MRQSADRLDAGAAEAGGYDSVDDLIASARQLIRPGRRQILGITGAPGAGKSSFARILADALGGEAELVGMDGFHLSEAELRRLGRHDRKGAVDTFDVAGYVALLRRLHANADPVVYAPVFDRQIEESISSALPIPREVPLVITEGNYLLVDDPEWSAVRELLTKCWYVDVDPDLRLRRLVDRHIEFGRSVEAATERSMGSDQRNADVVAATRVHADRIVTLLEWPTTQT